MEEVVHVQYEGNIATVTMNRPEAMNAVNIQMMEELEEVFRDLKERTDIQIVLLKGEGRAFSAGGDIKQMLSNELTDRMDEVMDIVGNMATHMYQSPQIMVSYIQGAAAGIGLSMALASDYIVAERAGKIAMNFIGIGLVPDGGGHFFLKERLGTERAKQLIWRGKVMDVEEAYRLGLVDEIIENGDTASFETFIKKLQQAPLKSMQETKYILRSANYEQLEQMLQKEKVGQLKMKDTADYREGIEAFVEKRAPKFQGK
ncbi:enoyl-CoA hydratase [Savagea sp. SN6]|uniref:Enoyl-CoA hydratase n=1 Tax=Savagea serpentis TaxID=2785297 RepID=A0A8J7GE78_9BACL|nr:enoyl-CoA hydratase [Savagea serpentis]MBF4501981.1 enoyl-CoA hydratase [Savagea serpentis]